MPKNKKKPMKKAATRAASAKTKRKPAALKAAKKAAKRSAPASIKAKPPVSAKLKAKPPVKANPQPNAKAKPPVSTKLKAKPPVKAHGQPKAKAKVVQARPGRSSALRSLILPPRPRKIAARLLTAPRSPRAVELAAVPAAVSSVSASRAVVVSGNTWQLADDAAARLGQATLDNEQRRAVHAALEGRDSLVLLTDDARALACYQVSALLLGQPTLVVSPIASDLRAQAETLISRKIPAVCVLPGLAGPDRSQTLGRIAKGGSLLVLCTPEALREADVRQALAKSGLALLVVEEAHCASELSHELRPSYFDLSATVQGLGAPPVMAVTRVASSAVRRDVCERLALRSPVTVQAAAVRDTLRIVTKLARGEARQASLVRVVGRLELPGIVFCSTPHDADSVYAALRGAHVAAQRYHSGMTPSERAAELESFLAPAQRSVMVAVSAFAPGSGFPGLGEPVEGSLGLGRGSCRADLRFVVHYQSPASIEQYLRELQLAGRDGLTATGVLLHESSHRSLHEVMLAQLRFRATHVAELGRALESAALEGRTVTVEALALATGQSRRTTDRLTALLADAGAVSRTGGWVRVLCSAEQLVEVCRKLGVQLYALREQDGRRLAAVTAFAESTACKLAFLQRYLGEAEVPRCGRCDACSSELLASQESIAPQASSRRAMVQEFSVQPVSVPPVSSLRSDNTECSAALADFSRRS
jgi:ATP-dependent DNA helicase RecQ